ncbi:MAG: hypothetical protein ACRC7O_03660, partial [Fimbriiglobus sp.]
MPVLLILLCAGGVACLAPLAAYVTWVAGLNRRDRPSVIPGTWDFVALLAGLAGFLIVGGGLLVSGMQSNAQLVLRGNAKQADAAMAGERFAWAATAGGYMLAVGAAAGFGLLSRSRALAVYNIDRPRAEAAISAALAGLDLRFRRVGDLWAEGGNGIVELETFDGLRHATVWVLADDRRKGQEIETAVRKHLLTSPAADNPAAVWLSSASVCLAFAVF